VTMHDIPMDGLGEVLRAWSGRGRLFDALAGIPDDNPDVDWSRQDVEGRARRILLADLEPLLLDWPTAVTHWIHALPAQSLRHRRVSDTPLPGTDWLESRMLGWPPEQFIVRERSRIADQVMSVTLRWTVDQIADIRHAATRVERSAGNIARPQIEAALALRRQPPLDATDGERPARSDVRVLAQSGWPWTKLASVAEALLAAQGEDLFAFAREQLMPDAEIRWRLFHLAVLGMLLKALRERGALIRSLRPLSGSASPGPSYAVELNGRRWDLWFEAAAIWGHYDRVSPYQTLTQSSLRHSATPLGADILLIIPGEEAIAFECKYGKASYIARNGYLQAMTYGQELRAHHAKHVTSCVVGPDPKVAHDQWLSDRDVTIGVIGPRHIRELEFVST